MTKALRLELAQYHELLDFAQFGAELDEISKRRLARGERAIEILKQPQYVTYTFVEQSLILFLLRNDFLDAVRVVDIHAFISQFVSYVKSVYFQEIYEIIRVTQDIGPEMTERLMVVAREFSKLFVPPSTKG